ncbi:MAG: hypothetical protein A3A44_02030 [Candidatus Sungbacteria bacterium RIFCSPLOWO2_01_FULL_60_25]|uniref:Uncharacterized protein n=1 Tax=Candidatus Sungbacteria bacterium RIFCSPLOWO2_01_FULL_60_25 TaxID=1802281 RepID=A0A1G2LG11_9BACT|nr:MAG: hypothetical protein A3A44_02030 [Candidatus Sungbacteria bacterium RIFCSPLOWO2_01_FULL_60_25]
MNIAFATLSILAITGLAYGARRFLRIRVCPICAGVSGTWLWILAGISFGLLDAGTWSLAAAIAMGGTVVGIAYQVERRLAPGRSPLLWKALCIPVGFVAAHSLLTAAYLAFSATAGLLALTAFLFLRQPRATPPEQSQRTADLEERMKECC